ncbi:hypothetical protein [Spirochaeta isovalerica]|uniref:Uncharacterized protein n=1 Tax=Spirochaeta isovalerica TaxID=150 RepID=A0A841R6W9_9SPIO|nr:hypothetical protein [Spirochaeta isovalerica]MBB6478790.1 hypothetical protein [Spirochaeta isovalerica]
MKIDGRKRCRTLLNMIGRTEPIAPPINAPTSARTNAPQKRPRNLIFKMKTLMVAAIVALKK